MPGPFGLFAERYYEMGLAPTPLGFSNQPKPSKAASIKGWQSWARARYTKEKLGEMLSSFGNNNIGLVLGSEVQEGLQLIAVDIDNVELQEHVENALPSLVCGKRGRKGATYFFLAKSDMPSRRVVNSNGTVVDLLCNKSQTVIPPSIHPDTNLPYEWTNKPLHELDLASLDVLPDEAVFEIEEIARGQAEYFIGGHIDKLGDFVGLNHMVFYGDGGGGNTHDTTLRAVAHMMATGWSDGAIVSRVRRAMKKAYERGGIEWDDPEWLARQVLGFIEDGRKKGIKPKEKSSKSQVPLDRVWADWLNSQFEYPSYYGSEIFSYSNGYYIKHNLESISAKVVRSFPNATSEKANSAVRTFALLNFKPDFGSEANDKICMKNGTLEISNMLLRNWRPEDELLYQMDVEWDPDAKCPKYEEFINWVFSGDEKAINMFEEFAGLSFVDDMTFQRTLWMIGPGGNGKSTLVSLLTTLHDPNVVSTIPISDVGDERKLTSMVGKLLNVSTEQSRLNNMADTVFKQITGGDPVAVRRLYKEVDNNVKLKVRFLCLTNEMPSTADTSDAMKRRMMILNCPNVITEDKKDPMLSSKLLMEKQGIIRRWVIALNRLRERRRFEISQTSETNVNEYLVANDPFRMWMREMYSPSDQENVPMDLYTNFAEWAKQAGYKNYMVRLPEFKSKIKLYGVKTASVKTGSGAEREVIYGRFGGIGGGGRDF